VIRLSVIWFQIDFVTYNSTDLNLNYIPQKMNAIVKLYIKVFLLMGIPWGILMLLFDLLDGTGFSFWKLVLRIVLFGGFMSLTLVSLHILKLNKIGAGKLPESLGVNHTRYINSSIVPNELASRLEADPAISKIYISDSENEIKLDTSLTWASFGENISIQARPIGSNQFEYKISSSPKLGTTLVDFGKNIQNVNRIEKILKS